MLVTKRPTKFFIRKLEALHSLMQEVAAEMDYYSGGNFKSEFYQHSKELLGASELLKTWISGIKKG